MSEHPIEPSKPNSSGAPVSDQTRLILRYAGRDVDDGTIAVDDLIAALNGFSGAFYKVAERESHDINQRIKVTGISRSSANVHLEIVQWAANHPKLVTAALGAAGYVGQKLVDIIVERIAGVAKAKKHIQNSPYTSEITVSGDNNQIILVNGLNARLPVDREVYDLLQAGTLDSDLDKMASPLREDAIDIFEIKHEGAQHPDLHLDASDRPYFARTRKEAATTAELTMVGTMTTISKTTNAGIFVSENGRRIRYRFTNEEKLAELYRQFAHLGPVRVTCTAKLDENLDVISIDISDIEALQRNIGFPEPGDSKAS